MTMKTLAQKGLKTLKEGAKKATLPVLLTASLAGFANQVMGQVDSTAQKTIEPDSVVTDYLNEHFSDLLNIAKTDPELFILKMDQIKNRYSPRILTPTGIASFDGYFEDNTNDNPTGKTVAADTSQPSLEFDINTLPTVEQVYELQNLIKKIALDPKYSDKAGITKERQTGQVVYYVTDGFNTVYSAGDGSGPEYDGIMFDYGNQGYLGVKPDGDVFQKCYNSRGEELTNLPGMTAFRVLKLVTEVNNR